VCHYNRKNDGEYRSYRGVGAGRKFLDALLEEVKKCNDIVKNEFNKKVVMSVEDYDVLEKAVDCHICGGKFTETDLKVLDHCHVTGKFRGAAHPRAGGAKRRARVLIPPGYLHPGKRKH
jgi:hypothetical protein